MFPINYKYNTQSIQPTIEQGVPAVVDALEGVLDRIVVLVAAFDELLSSCVQLLVITPFSNHVHLKSLCNINNRKTLRGCSKIS